MSSAKSTVKNVNGEQLRVMMRRVASPVVVVTTASSGEIRGMTVGSFTSVSLDPPLVCFNVGKEARMQALLEEADYFSVHVLRSSQDDLSNHFARPDLSANEQFGAVTFDKSENGIPVIQGTLGVLHCSIYGSFPAGDHSVVIGKVEEIDMEEEGDPLIYFDREYTTVR